MNTLVEAAIQSNKDAESKRLEDLHNRAKIRVKECFGVYADSDLTEIGKPCHFRIKNTKWNLVYGFFDGFTLWHADRKDGDCSDCRYCAWQIVDMASLGQSLEAVFKSHGR